MDFGGSILTLLRLNVSAAANDDSSLLIFLVFLEALLAIYLPFLVLVAVLYDACPLLLLVSTIAGGVVGFTTAETVSGNFASLSIGFFLFNLADFLTGCFDSIDGVARM